MRAYLRIPVTIADLWRPIWDQLQDQLERITLPLAHLEDLEPVWVELTAIDTAAAGTRILHRLGRQPKGWAIVDKRANADVWLLSWDKVSITLRASAAVSVRLKVW